MINGALAGDKAQKALLNDRITAMRKAMSKAIKANKVPEEVSESFLRTNDVFKPSVAHLNPRSAWNRSKTPVFSDSVPFTDFSGFQTPAPSTSQLASPGSSGSRTRRPPPFSSSSDDEPNISPSMRVKHPAKRTKRTPFPSLSSSSDDPDEPTPSRGKKLWAKIDNHLETFRLAQEKSLQAQAKANQAAFLSLSTSLNQKLDSILQACHPPAPKNTRPQEQVEAVKTSGALDEARFLDHDELDDEYAVPPYPGTYLLTTLPSPLPLSPTLDSSAAPSPTDEAPGDATSAPPPPDKLYHFPEYASITEEGVYFGDSFVSFASSEIQTLTTSRTDSF